MEENSCIKPNLTRAYGIFVRELKQQVQEALSLLCVSGTPEAAACKTLAGSFHKIKGGAGFFALHEVAALARELESHLKGEFLVLVKNMEEVRSLVRALERAADAVSCEGTEKD